MANNYYVGQAPQANEQAITRPTMNTPHTPVNISPDMTQVSALNTMAQHLNAIAETAKKLNDFNDTTQAMTTVMQLSNDAIQNQWTPQEYQKQLNAITSKMKFDSPQLQAEINRRIEVTSIDTMSKLTAIQAKLAAQQTLVKLDQLQQTVLTSVNDKATYMSAMAHFDTALSDAVANKAINPAAAEKIRNDFRQKAVGNIIAAKLEENPTELINEIKKGDYNGLLSESDKLNIIKSAKQYKLKQEEYKLQQMKIQRANIMFTYMNKLGKGEIGISDVMRSKDIPLDEKQKMIEIWNNIQANNVGVLAEYGQIKQNIYQGKYQSLDDLQQDMIKKGMPRNYFLDAQNKFLILQEHEKSANGKSNSTFEKIINSKINEAMAATKVNYMSNFVDTSDAKRNSKVDTLKATDAAQQVKSKMLIMLANCTAKNSEADCINQMDTFKNQAIAETLLPYDKDHFLNTNSNYFNNIYFQSGYDLFGKGYKQITDTNFSQKLQKMLFELFRSEKYNPTHDYDLSKMLNGTASPVFKIPVKKEYVDKYKIGFLKFRIKVNGKTLQVIPENQKYWDEIYGKR